MQPSGSSSAPPAGEGRWSRWGKTAFDKSIVVSDWAAGYANAASAKAGGERFWPKSGDMVEEIDKCTRILRTFTVEGLETQQAEEEAEIVLDSKGNKVKKRRKVLKKIPPKAIKKAKGIVIYTAMRTGVAPFGGAGGTGLVLARLPDGSWSAPASISPNNLSVGLLLGFDIFDVVLLLNSDKAMESFFSHKVTLGAELAVAAGPVGSGTGIESGVERAPVYSYVRSRGFYAGVEAIAQVFLSRFDENERFYYWPGIKGEDVLKGKVKIPASVMPLHRALADAETGRAQGDKLERTVYDVVKIPQSDLMARLSQPESGGVTPEGEDILQDGERLRLPPTPEELDALENAGIPDEEDLRLAQKEREEVYKLPAPPMHKHVKRYWDQHPNKSALRPTHRLVMGGPASARSSAGGSKQGTPANPWETTLAMPPKSDVDQDDGAAGSLPPAYRYGDETDDAGDNEDSSAQYATEKEATDEIAILAPPPRRGQAVAIGSSTASSSNFGTKTGKSPRARKAVPSDVAVESDSVAVGQSPAASDIDADSEAAALEKGHPHILARNIEDEWTADAILGQAATGEYQQVQVQNEEERQKQHHKLEVQDQDSRLEASPAHEVVGDPSLTDATPSHSVGEIIDSDDLPANDDPSGSVAAASSSFPLALPLTSPPYGRDSTDLSLQSSPSPSPSSKTASGSVTAASSGFLPPPQRPTRARGRSAGGGGGAAT